MPIPFNYNLKKIHKEVRLSSNLNGNNTDWMAWWYCGIYKNFIAESQPNVLVAFRELSDGNLSDNLIFRRIPLTALGQVRIGTVWKDSMCCSEVVFDTKTFNVDFTENSWKFVSFNLSARNGIDPPYPQNIYPLQYQEDKNWLIEFKLPTSGKLIVPCLEFFSRCYGRSQELKRILTSYPWHGESESSLSRLYAAIDEPEEPGKWKVKLRKRLVNGDVIFLAHAKYDPYAAREAKHIYAQIESQHTTENKAPIFIKVAPWFLGLAEIKVQGIWFDNNRSFLAQRIIGCSDPIGVSIIRDRDNSSNAENAAENKGVSEAWAGIPNKVLSTLPEIIDLTGNIEPDNGSATVNIQDPDFEVLGQPRVVIDVRKHQANESAATKSIKTDHSEFSSGENYGSGKDVGYASIHAKQLMESQGMLRDMWDAMLFLMKENPTLIQSVDWFTFQDGFSSEAKPALIALQHFGADSVDEIDGEIKNWVYLDKTSRETRGVLVARLILDKTTIYILEVQRRPRKKKDPEGKTKESEESYKGLVFMLNDPGQLEAWLTEVLSEIRYIKGVMQKLVGLCPGKVATFNHSPASDEQVPCEAAMLNALYKMGVNIKCFA